MSGCLPADTTGREPLLAFGSQGRVLRLHDLDECARNVLAHKGVTAADADYVLRWLRQSGAPSNIIALQERVVRLLP